MSENKIAATMIQHIGTKLVKRSAEPMTKAEYNEYRGWSMPESEDPSELVYLVEYEADERNKPNHDDHAGYISMSPKYVFDESYRQSGNLTFGMAIAEAKKGKKIARSGWNGKNMYAVIMPGYPEGVEVNEATQKAHDIPQGTKLVYRPYFQLYTAQSDVAMWAPSGSDALAEDWIILE